MIKAIWRRILADRIVSAVEARLASRFAEVLALQRERLDQVESKMAMAIDPKPWKKNLHIPDLGIHPPITDAFMVYSTVSAGDFYHPSFRELCGELGIPSILHRKYWEWVYVLHHSKRLGVVGPGRQAYCEIGTRHAGTVLLRERKCLTRSAGRPPS